MGKANWDENGERPESKYARKVRLGGRTVYEKRPMAGDVADDDIRWQFARMKAHLPTKGYAFLERSNGGDVFIHVSLFEKLLIGVPQVGASLYVVVDETAKPRPVAIHVRLS